MRKALATLATAAAGLAIAAQPAVAFQDRDCSDFPTHRAAQRFFKHHHPNRDPHGLDGDNDGIACESLP
jgi:hypothetical protein